MDNSEFIKAEVARRTEGANITEADKESLIRLFNNLLKLNQKSQEDILTFLDSAFIEDESGGVGISEEIEKALAIKDSKTGIATNTPFLKGLQKRQGVQRDTTEAIKLFQDNDFTIKSGGLTVFQKGAFDVLARAFWDGRITKDNKIVLEKGQAGRWFTACTGTPSKEAMEDFLEALDDMRKQPLNYSTTADLADIIGLEAAALADSIPGLKQTGSAYEMNEHILDKVDIIKGRYKRRGQPVDVYLIKMGNITTKLLQAMPWYEARPQEFFQVKYWDDGKLKRLGYSKKRKTLQTYIFDEVFSKQRANDSRGGRSYYSDMLPYEKIFSACGLDVSHGTERKNRVEDVKRIFEHLLREGEIYAFSEYDTKRQKAVGIKYQLGAAQYIIDGEGRS